jgi:hypothetical protein
MRRCGVQYETDDGNRDRWDMAITTSLSMYIYVY